MQATKARKQLERRAAAIVLAVVLIVGVRAPSTQAGTLWSRHRCYVVLHVLGSPPRVVPCPARRGGSYRPPAASKTRRDRDGSYQSAAGGR
ncbi:MAG TPA: hypothetical protein VFI17_03585 [Solirubrobacterales bacterium]|nr:hypothetical protein [Solirubrobacterales bacterium]